MPSLREWFRRNEWSPALSLATILLVQSAKMTNTLHFGPDHAVTAVLVVSAAYNLWPRKA